MPRPLKVATPALELAVPEPTTVPLESDAVMLMAGVVTTLLPASCTLITGWVSKA